MPSVRSVHKELPACLANLSPMMMSGFLLLCSCCRACETAFGDEVVVNPERTISLMDPRCPIDDCFAAGRSLAGSTAATDRVSGESFERGINLLQNFGFALLAPIQGNHLLVRFNLVDIGRQFFEMIQ